MNYDVHISPDEMIGTNLTEQEARDMMRYEERPTYAINPDTNDFIESWDGPVTIGRIPL